MNNPRYFYIVANTKEEAEDYYKKEYSAPKGKTPHEFAYLLSPEPTEPFFVGLAPIKTNTEKNERLRQSELERLEIWKANTPKIKIARYFSKFVPESKTIPIALLKEVMPEEYRRALYIANGKIPPEESI